MGAYERVGGEMFEFYKCQNDGSNSFKKKNKRKKETFGDDKFEIFVS